MPDAPDFPRIYYHPTEPSRIFESQEELTAAGAGWVKTPTEAADAAATATTPTEAADAAATATTPTPTPAPEAEDEPPTRRSHR